MLDEEEDDDEEDEELGSPPKLMLMLGKSALRPSCHSFTFRFSTLLLFSAWRQGEMKLLEKYSMTKNTDYSFSLENPVVGSVVKELLTKAKGSSWTFIILS